ncbi:Protein CBR-NHR-159 [Caenorhabditis briggsae]|uniref:Protein CBR-NHR-159 n=1 Tax=Caenorhabditis briggsae TaxID=6238 RepID=A8X2D4_CAEBR|nr:Protein CBR-NHR-159 [Caenorhabditis briggsae]CAP26794.2 Protein CBR-NHR-159 [Caenorhabditis briggsae]
MEHEQHWKIELISPEKSPEPPPNSVYFPPRKCVICYRPAYCKNYGTLTCDACKMFFRRVVTEKLEYECSNENSCYSDFTETSEICPKCKSCRYQRCLAFGMRYVIKQSKKQILELKMRKEMEMTKNQFLRPQDWSFFALYTTVDFLLNLDFMQELETSEKLILLKHSASKCSLFGGAMRTYRGKRDRMITVDGQDIYPDEMKKVLENEEGADDFLNRIRSFVVSKLVELSVTTEEYILICVILFCDPGGFADLLSLCPIIQRNFEDLQYLTMVFKLSWKGVPIQFKTIVEELV